MEKGIVKRVIGPVVDIRFPSGSLPELYHAVHIRLPERLVVLEVVQQIGEGSVRCIALSSTDGIVSCRARKTPRSAPSRCAKISRPARSATRLRQSRSAGIPKRCSESIAARSRRRTGKPWK